MRKGGIVTWIGRRGVTLRTMKVICAPDSFKGSLAAAEAASAMAAGLRDAIPGLVVDCCPVGDGGEGTLAALLGALDGQAIGCRVLNAHGEPVDAQWGVFARQGFSFVESASAIGLDRDPTKRNVLTASSFGVGQLIAAACEEAPARLLVGLGGSASNDGGCGMAQALGVRFFDPSARLIDVPLSGATLSTIDRIDLSGLSPPVAGTDICALCDVTNPLTGTNGAAHVYAPQKGASAAEVEALDAGLIHLAALLMRYRGIDVDNVPGAGAAGGLGAGLLAFTGATIVSGIETILDALQFDERVAGADLCLTGEGRLDGQSLSGKACMGVAARAKKQGVPVIALVGDASPGARECLAAGLADVVVIGDGLPAEESIRNAAPLLTAAAARTARKYLGNNDTIDGRLVDRK